MGLQCKACGATVVTGSEVCPACGTKLSSKLTYLRLAALVMVIVLVGKAYLDKPAETDAGQAPPTNSVEQ